MPSAGSLPAALVVEEGWGAGGDKRPEGTLAAAPNERESYISSVEECSK